MSDRAQALAQLYANAYEAAHDFIESHVADPDITPWMRETYPKYLAAKDALEAFLDQQEALRDAYGG